uniref:Retrotransposon gag domain-containing protein n=1 Tax=Trichogramma kaykai TaxID=54128 RepID=A0ABD2W6C8_9HYME
MKSSNTQQWMQEFEDECKLFKIGEDKDKIEIFRLLQEKLCLDWYGSMLIKLSIKSRWETWKENFIETYSNRGWSHIRYTMTFRFQAGSFLEYAVKKERLLLEVQKYIDRDTLIDLIAIGLPNFVMDRIDRDALQEVKDLYNEVGRLEHLVKKKDQWKGKCQEQN